MSTNLLNTNYSYILLIPFAIQAVAVFIDEFYFHHQRGLGLWERLGHPFDTLSVISVYVFCLLAPYTFLNLIFGISIATFSCIFVTKDEFVHKKLCAAEEQWLHSILFLVHSLTSFILIGFWYLNQKSIPTLFSIKSFFSIQILILILFMIYQIVYWNLFYPKSLQRSLHES